MLTTEDVRHIGLMALLGCFLGSMTGALFGVMAHIVALAAEEKFRQWRENRAKQRQMKELRRKTQEWAALEREKHERPE